MRLHPLVLLLSLVLLSSPASADVYKWLEFETDGVLPSAEPDIVLRYYTAQEAPTFSVSGGRLIGNSMPSATNYLQYAYPAENLVGGGISNAEPWYIEARMRVLEANTGGIPGLGFGSLTVYNGKRYLAQHTVTGIRFLTGAGFQWFEVPFDWTQWHTIRMESDPGTNRYRAYIDGALVLDDGIPDANGLNGFTFGLNTANVGAHIEWEYVRFEAGPLAVPTTTTSFGAIKAQYD